MTTNTTQTDADAIRQQVARGREILLAAEEFDWERGDVLDYWDNMLALKGQIVPTQVDQIELLVEALEEIANVPVFHDEDGLTIDVGVRARDALAAVRQMGEGE